MRIEFLGTGGFHPNERRHTACVMLPEIGLVFDAGTSVFRVPPRLKTKELHIFLSHAHLDHIAGLTYLLAPLLRRQIEKARLYGTETTLRTVSENLFHQQVFPIRPNYEFEEIRQQMTVPGGGVLTFCPLLHPGGSVGYRIDWPGRSLAYITDTTTDDSYVEFIRGVDVLIHECYFSDDMAEWSIKTGHSNTTPVAELAQKANVGRMYLTHIDPDRPDDDPIGIATARAIFPETYVAEDLMVVEL